MPSTKVSKGSNGQYKVTIPVGIAESMELDGEELEWRVESGNRLSVKIKDD